MEREEPKRGARSDEELGGKRSARERLREALDKARRAERDAGADDREKPSIHERLDDVLNKSRERLEPEGEREVEKDEEVENDRDIDLGPTHGLQSSFI